LIFRARLTVDLGAVFTACSAFNKTASLGMTNKKTTQETDPDFRVRARFFDLYIGTVNGKLRFWPRAISSVR
jgi:hypothetical protein